MKYTAILNGKEREIEITRLEETSFLIVVDGEEHHVDAHRRSSDWISLLIDNHSYDISFSTEGDNLELNFWNRYYQIEVLDERKMRMRRIQTHLDLSGPEIIKTSMPGKVVKVLVKEGQKVEAGRGIIIIEAMKMENQIQCKNGGIIKSIRVQAGTTVEADVVLVEIEPLPAE